MQHAVSQVSGLSRRAMVSLAQKDQLSAPVVGNNGVYVYKVYEQNKDVKNYDEAAEIKALDASNAYRFGFQAIQSLVKKLMWKITVSAFIDR